MEERKNRNPSLPSMVYLENDVKELKDCESYLTNDLKGKLEVDLLLGVQGWRRFIYYNMPGEVRDKKSIICFWLLYNRI